MGLVGDGPRPRGIDSSSRRRIGGRVVRRRASGGREGRDRLLRPRGRKVVEGGRRGVVVLGLSDGGIDRDAGADELGGAADGVVGAPDRLWRSGRGNPAPRMRGRLPPASAADGLCDLEAAGRLLDPGGGGEKGDGEDLVE
ncbi:MAG: hypothetical protein AVDCRST_MAG19-2535, partial [uncultured Thermomicrobiales bacterium]